MGERVRVKRRTYLDKGNMTTFTVWHPQLKVEGVWCYLPDENSRTKLIESETPELALEMTLRALREIEGNRGQEVQE